MLLFNLRPKGWIFLLKVTENVSPIFNNLFLNPINLMLFLFLWICCSFQLTAMISTIEGVGNEVIQFFIFLGIVLICLLLWLSTRVRSQDEPFFSTVYVLERRYGRTSEEPARVPHPTENNTEGITFDSSQEIDLRVPSWINFLYIPYRKSRII